MPSVNLRELRNTPQLMRWVEAGVVVELRKRDRIVARIVPETPAPQQVQWPDFEACLKRNFGDRIHLGADLLVDEREKIRL